MWIFWIVFAVLFVGLEGLILLKAGANREAAWAKAQAQDGVIG